MNNILEKFRLSLCVVVIFFPAIALSFGGPPVNNPVFREKADWNVRWQFQPGTELVFDAIDMESPYYERLRNSTITGVSNTTLHPALEFLHSRNGIAFRLNVSGVSRTPTRSMTQAAVIYSDSELVFRSTLQYVFGGNHLYRTASSASGSLVNRNIRIQLKDRCFPNVKKRLIMAGFQQSAEILRQRGLGKLQNELHAEMVESLGSVFRMFDDGFELDTDKTLPVAGFRSHSDKQGAYGTLRLGTTGHVKAAFPDSAERLFQQYPVALALKPSVFEQAMQARLGGKTFPIDRLPEYMFGNETKNDLSSNGENKENTEDASCHVTLNSERPLELTVSDGSVTLIIYADQFVQSQKTYPGMNIEMTYRLVAAGEDFADETPTDDVAAPLLVLDGPVRVTPKDETDENHRNLRTVTIRRWLLNFFDRDLPKQVSRDSLVYVDEDGEPIQIGQYAIAADSFVFEDGWLAVGCRLIPESSL